MSDRRGRGRGRGRGRMCGVGSATRARHRYGEGKKRARRRWAVGGVVGRYVYEAADNSTGPNPRLQESICGAREGVEDGDERLYSICTLLGWV